MEKQESSSYGWVVTICGIIINLALGAIYAWSIFKANLMGVEDAAGHLTPNNFGFALDKFQTALPYAIALGVFSLMTIFAGKMQDKIGPRFVATAGGAILGIGLFVCSLAKPDNNPVMFLILGFGVLGGAGIGLAYASALPPAVKWFPASKKGLISGLVVGGFGISAAYVYPLTKWLIETHDPSFAFKVLAGLFAVMVIVPSQFMKNPPAGYVPGGAAPAKPGSPAPAAAAKIDYAAGEMLGTSSFYLTWIMYFFAAGAGLMVIGSIGKLAKDWNLPLMITWCATVLAIGNCSGRVISGVVSDKLGRTTTMLIVFVLQIATLLAFPRILNSSDALFALGSFLIGFNFGSCLSLFPAITADFFGLKNLGVNYGFVFTAYGIGGVILTLMGGKLAYAQAFNIAAGLVAISAVLTFIVKAPKAKKA